MDRMSEPLTTFKDFVEADLRRAARRIIKIQVELDPQFRMSTPDGDYWIAIALPDDAHERRAMLHWVSTFMAWKQAMSFTLASELEEPDCISCIGVSYREAYACLSRITRHPRPLTRKNFGAIEWFDRSNIGAELLQLLPRGTRAIDDKEIAMVEKWFGANGKFPAVHIASREVRGLQ
jgi:hypothetical protein